MTKVVVFPADTTGCGTLRMITPAQELIKRGHDVRVVLPQDRGLVLHVTNGKVTDVDLQADVVVFQRLTHPLVHQAVAVLRRKGVAVVVDVDDDLSAIHPANPAFAAMHPTSPTGNTWDNLRTACREATLVTVSTPALLDVYARHGRGHVLYNRLPDTYRNVPHIDSDTLGWPASFHSHPDDPQVVGGAVARLAADGHLFRMVGDTTGAGRAFGLGADPLGGGVPIEEWPAAVASLGVGIAPLADTRFNRAKSWLKPLEMCALGVPWVASPRVEYARLHREGAGVLAERPRDWYRLVKGLLGSVSARVEAAEVNRVVAENHWLSDHAWRWWEAWEKAASDR